MIKKAIVTGANGFVGKGVCKELIAKGIDVIAIIRNGEANTEFIKDLPGIRIVNADLSDFYKLNQLISDRDIDIFYHFAWTGSAGTLRSDSDVQMSNVKYTCDTVKTCAAMGCKRFVFASSIMEYEIEAIMATDAIPGINTLYSSAKVAADYMSRAIAGSLGIDYIPELP